MGDIFIFNSTDDAVSMPGERNKGNEVAAKKQLVAGPKRKGLADITNFPPASKKKMFDDHEHIQRLWEENAALMKQLVERNKTIQLCGIEVQKLRLNLQNSQQQNRQLAQANSQILAQLNAGKDKLKVLEHELACRKSLLAVKSLELLEVRKSGQCREIFIEKTTSRDAGASSLADDNDGKPCSTNCRQQLTVQGLFIAEGARAEENPNSKRCRTRRQSSRFKSEDLELAEDTINKNDVALPACQDRIDNNDIGLLACLQTVGKRLEVCPMSDTSQEAPEEALVSSSGDIDSGRPRITNAQHPRRGKRVSIVKGAFNNEKSETTRPRVRTRSSMLKSGEQEGLKVDAKCLVSPQNDNKRLEDCAIPISLPVNGKDAVKEEADLSQEIESIQDVNVTLQQDNPCSSSPESTEQRGMSTTKVSSREKKTEFKRPYTRRQSSRLKCKDERPGECCPQNDDNEEPKTHSLPLYLSGNTVKTVREETDVMPDRIKKASVGRPLRWVKCKDEKLTGCHPQDDDNKEPNNHSGPLCLSENTVKREREDIDVVPEKTKRSSVGRPVRRAAEKVQSYKEVPLKTKLRRPE